MLKIKAQQTLQKVMQNKNVLAAVQVQKYLH